MYCSFLERRNSNRRFLK
ncbi:hypothetical protein Patl1_26766 [Pistacia atlantica]|uniref:Uncharacterized protein n=1 Tax=Pistacia atlantica TaxID=434234 RepID=A0ACC1B018_9ROSI|nr:hypothetical protein Patl1_26766 [Pistacia atlantica]